MITKKARKSNLKNKLVIIVCVLVVFVSIFIALESFGITHFISSFNNTVVDQPKDNKTNIDSKPSTIKGGNDSNPPAEPTSNDITLSTRREADGSVTILTELKNYSDGTCNLTITNGIAKYTSTAAVLFQDTFSMCEGFSVPSNAVPSGTWQITLAVTSKGKVNTKTISAEVK